MSETPKNRGGRPRVDATPLTVRVPPDLLAAVDKLAEDIEGTRPDALRFALMQYMESDGFLQPKPRLPRHFLVELTRKEAEALAEAVGLNHELQQETLSNIIRNWLIANGHLKDDQ